MRFRFLTIIVLSFMLISCAGGTRGTGALIDRRLMDRQDEHPPLMEKKKPPLLNKLFGWECGDLDGDGEDDCKY